MIVRRVLLSGTSALIASLTFEPIAIWPLALVAWIPFFWSIRGTTTRQAFYLGLLHGFILYGVTLSWLWSIFAGVSFALWGMLALFTAGFAFLVAKSSLRSPLLLASLWTGIEFLRSEIFLLSFPWITPGTGLPPNWITPIVGVYGISFIIVLGAFLLLEKKKSGAVLLAALATTVLTIKPVQNDEAGFKVGLVQNESGIDQRCQEASQTLTDEVDILVWPEYSLGIVDGQSKAASESLTQHARLLVGGGYEIDSSDRQKGYNTAFTFSKKGIIGRHVKNHPVHFFADGEKGTTAIPIATEFGKIGTPVCFDCDHQDVIRKQTQAGAEFFLIPSMDAKHWSARQHEQHGWLFRHRAAENGRWLAIASTSGVTQVIDSRGQVRDRLPLMEEGTLSSMVYPSTHRTLFQRGGWLIGPITLVFVIFWIIRIIWKRFSGKPLAHSP